MWLCDPKILCQKHLCGEHVEMHMFLGTLKEGKKFDGYLKNNCFQPRSLYERHEELKNEMIRRGYNHKSDILLGEFFGIYYGIKSLEKRNWEIDKKKSLKDLLSRCSECRKRFQKK